MNGIASVLCPDCGMQKVRIKDLIVRACIDVDMATYAFACPECKMVTVERLLAEVRAPLFHHPSVKVVWYYAPAELFEDKHHPPLTEDDCLDFVRELDSL